MSTTTTRATFGTGELAGRPLITGRHARPVRLSSRRATRARYVSTYGAGRRAIGAAATLLVILAGILALGLVGRADVRATCDEAWTFASGANAETRATCAEEFPGRYPHA